MILPQILLREGHRGGRRKQGHSNLDLRFDLAQEENWSELLLLWTKDLDKVNLRDTKYRHKKDTDANHKNYKERLRETVLDKIGKGHISRAMGMLELNGLANLNNPLTLQALRSKFPQRRRPLPDKVTSGYCISDIHGFRESLDNIKTGTAAGPSGMRVEYLVALSDKFDHSQLDRFKRFCL